MIIQSLVQFFNTLGKVVKVLNVFNQEATKKNYRKSVHKQLDNLMDFADESDDKYLLDINLTEVSRDTINPVIRDSMEYMDADILKLNEDGLSDNEMETGYYLAFKNMNCRKIALHLDKSYDCIRTREQRLFDKTGKHNVRVFSEYFKITFPNYLPPQH